MTRRIAFPLGLALVFAAFWAPRAPGALRASPEGASPFGLLELATEGGTSWYDAEAWFKHFPGAVDGDPVRGSLVYREGGHSSTLRIDAPYALRDRQALGEPGTTKVIDGRLAVSERFLVERSADLLGRRVSVERAHGTGTLRVVLDPGHGGAEAGSRAPGAPAEKDAVLTLAKELAGRLRKRGFEVHLTREEDRALGPTERVSETNRWEADLFLSLHASGAARPQARGFEVFVATPPAPGTDSKLWVGGQVGRAGESRRWAQAVRSAAGHALPTFDRGLQEIPSPLLEAIAGPACLLEAGNLSWPEDAAALTKPAGRSALADALAGAAEAFFR